MANEEQLSILKQGVEVWNNWRSGQLGIEIDLVRADLSYANLSGAKLSGANLGEADLRRAQLYGTYLDEAYLGDADLSYANLRDTNLTGASLRNVNLIGAFLSGANLWQAKLSGSNFRTTRVVGTNFGELDMSSVTALDEVEHTGPSSISTDTFARSKGRIPELFLRGCGLSDWEIHEVKLYNPNLSNSEVNEILYKIYDLRASQALQISPLFISYSHGDSKFVDNMGDSLTKKGIRYWRDIHDMKAGRMEKQIDRAIRQKPTVLLVLSEHSLSSDWVEHEVRMARGLEKEMGRDVLCPIALDDSWKSSPWPKRIMEQITEYNILDFSDWQDDRKFEGMFRKLIDGLELFYKG